MANPFNGEVLIEDGDKRYKFVFGMYAQVALEELAGERWTAFLLRRDEWSTTDVLHLFQAGLARHQEALAENTTESRRAVTDLMDRLGTVRCGEIFREALEKASPMPDKKEPKEDAKGNARPPIAKKARALQATIT